ncbi:hypothetical protein [Methylobacterium gnaphalii]|uniref:Uncharacterized protein n=1 Tax=Methylobacterium gnaphalii TaxID=1010610 RepID=A0A512JS79_9HYPH|nr:hypothetical protein [Methylobacterium gnaphalii]GEP12806.1 hypothetical protein MGN01_46510 [Methylobacterium gnaphalii]GLS50635.1 hypothetical protein GCM10007885_34880 [Methylobacterium gnaphalii]
MPGRKDQKATPGQQAPLVPTAQQEQLVQQARRARSDRQVEKAIQVLKEHQDPPAPQE